MEARDRDEWKSFLEETNTHGLIPEQMIDVYDNLMFTYTPFNVLQISWINLIARINCTDYLLS